MILADGRGTDLHVGEGGVVALPEPLEVLVLPLLHLVHRHPLPQLKVATVPPSRPLSDRCSNDKNDRRSKWKLRNNGLGKKNYIFAIRIDFMNADSEN